MSKRLKLRVFLKIFIGIFIGINVFGFFVGNFLHKQMCLKRGRNPGDSQPISEVLNIKEDALYKEEEVSINTKRGYKLYGVYIKNPKPTRDTVVLVHGLMRTYKSMGVTARLYLEKGFNVLMYDSRNNGKSGGRDTTFGHFEKYDLDEWIKYLSKKNPGGIIGVHGRSMGAATALLHSGMNEASKRVSFYVSDCAYSNLREEFIYVLDKIDLSIPSSFFAFYGSLVAKLKSGFRYSDISPKDAVKNTSTPTMFIHGKKDKLVPVSMCKELFNAKTNGLKKMYIAEKAGHGESFKVDSKEYTKQLYEFIDDVLDYKK